MVTENNETGEQPPLSNEELTRWVQMMVMKIEQLFDRMNELIPIVNGMAVEIQRNNWRNKKV